MMVRLDMTPGSRRTTYSGLDAYQILVLDAGCTVNAE